MNYGLPYMGSKSRICNWLMAHLPPADTFIDLFAGGCAVTHAALLSGRYKRVIANDIQGEYPKLFLRLATEGLKPEEWHPVSREEFFLRAPHDALVCLVWSFGNKCDSYLYNRDIEELMLNIHRFLFFDEDIEKKLESYYNVIVKIVDFIKKNPNEKNAVKHDLLRLVGIHRLIRMNEIFIGKTINLSVSAESYENVLIPKNSLVYADPPYIGTENYGSGEFDYDAFYNWLRSVPYPVYVSEYHMPDDFIPIAKTKLQCTLNDSSSNTVTERLFLHERFAHPDVQLTLL